MAKLTDYKKHDRTPFVKSNSLFVELRYNGDEFMDKVVDSISYMLELSQRATKLMKYIHSHQDKGRVDMSPRRIMRELGYSSKSFSPIYSGIGQLVEKKIIAKTNDKHIYFVNSLYIPTGNKFNITYSYVNGWADRPEQADRHDQVSSSKDPGTPKGFGNKEKKP